MKGGIVIVCEKPLGLGGGGAAGDFVYACCRSSVVVLVAVRPLE